MSSLPAHYLPIPLIPEDRVLCRAVVPGKPVPKRRARVNRINGQIYHDRASKDDEARIGWHVKADNAGIEPNTSHNLGVIIRFFGATNKRADVDNMTKAVLDACNGLVWGDDRQIVEIVSQAIWSDANPRTELTVYRVGEDVRRYCERCGGELLRKNGPAPDRFCSKACYDESQRLGQYVPCAVCTKRIYRQNEKLAAYDRHYCSPECKATANSGQRVCRYCHQSFTTYASQPRSFCSEVCRVAFHDDRATGRVYTSRHKPGKCDSCGNPTSRPNVNRCRACYYRSQST